MADTEILKRAEKYIKGKGKTLNKYDLVGFANAETELLSKHILELQADKGILTDENKQAKELLRRWLQTSKASGCDNINIVTDTEQFLNCSEKPNN
jgi:hypothetical protein